MQEKKNIKLLLKDQFDLKGRDHMYRSIIENMSESALVVSKKGTIVYSNKRFAELTSYPLQKIIGSNIITLLNDSDTEKFESCINEATTRRSFCELKIESGRFRKIPVLVSVTSFQLENEEYYSFIISDITARKQTEDNLEEKMQWRTQELIAANKRLRDINRELQEVNKYLDNFAHTIAHDMRAPVANLKLAEQMLEVAPEEKKSTVFKNVQENIRNLDNTLKGLVQIIEFQDSKEAHQEVDVEKTIKSILEQKEKQIEQQQATIKIISNTNKKINYVGGYIRSIALNMINNALRYSMPGRNLVLEINLDRNDEFFILTFRDNGIGIDLEKNNNKLFKPFQHFSDDETGMGIGLHIINNMVRRNGGSINVESELNKGTSFIVYLKEYS